MGLVANPINKCEVLVGWEKPREEYWIPAGWLKQGCPGKTVVDGGSQFVMLVVDEFTVLLLNNLETCSSLQAGMWGAYYGLDLTWSLGFLKLEIKLTRLILLLVLT